MLLDVPDAIDGERLRLRRFLPGDGPMLLQAISANRAHLQATAPDYLVSIETAEEGELIVRNSHADWLKREVMNFACIERDKNAFVGEVQLQLMDDEVPVYEVGYWLQEQFQGRGLAVEGVRLASNFAFRQLEAEKLVIACDADNLGSAKVAERAGFTQEGILRRQACNRAGIVVDRVYFGMIRSEWQPK